jgi:hypothetical protein
LNQKFGKQKNFHIISFQEQLNYNFYENFNNFTKINDLKSNSLFLKKNLSIETPVFNNFVVLNKDY